MYLQIQIQYSFNKLIDKKIETKQKVKQKFDTKNRKYENITKP